MAEAARFKQADVTRAVRGCERAGLRVASVQIDANGKIVILAAGSESRSGQGWEDLS